jgi:acyl-CoA synthetase (AMP-forming)/AMP-acid ligase II
VDLGEVEATLYRHPAIREATVLPVPDDLLGNRIRAVVTTDGAGCLARENVREHCRQWLANYMVPEIVEFREALPGTSTGKINQVTLAQEQEEFESAGDGDGRSTNRHTEGTRSWRRSLTTTSVGNWFRIRRCCR